MDPCFKTIFLVSAYSYSSWRFKIIIILYTYYCYNVNTELVVNPENELICVSVYFILKAGYVYHDDISVCV